MKIVSRLLKILIVVQTAQALYLRLPLKIDIPDLQSCQDIQKITFSLGRPANISESELGYPFSGTINLMPGLNITGKQIALTLNNQPITSVISSGNNRISISQLTLDAKRDNNVLEVNILGQSQNYGLQTGFYSEPSANFSVTLLSGRNQLYYSGEISLEASSPLGCKINNNFKLWMPSLTLNTPTLKVAYRSISSIPAHKIYHWIQLFHQKFLLTTRRMVYLRRSAFFHLLKRTTVP